MRQRFTVVFALLLALAACGTSDETPVDPLPIDEPPADTTEPATRITAAPDAWIASTEATFAFEADEPARFECALDDAPFSACASPHTLTALAEGPHRFLVRAIDEAGNVDATPAFRDFAVDRTAAVTTIDEAPAPISNATGARFVFHASEEALFECALDSAAFAPCSSPWAVDALAEGTHAFRVRAIDRAGNVEDPARRWEFAIDRTAPRTTLEEGPPPLSNAESVRFVFTADEESLFECALDGAAFEACSSPHVIGGIGEGSHLFLVRAVDPAGNVEAPAVTLDFSIDRTPPVTTLTGPGGSTGRTAEFAFAANEEARFECALDGGAFEPCSSPWVLVDLASGQHVLAVRAIDDAGNVETAPVTWVWTVEVDQTGQRIRIVAANVTSGNYQSYDPGHGARILQGIAPDVVLIQEFNYGNNDAASIRSFVDDTFGPEFHYYRESGAQIPNGVISRLPILEAGKWTDTEVSNRSFVWARLDLPGTSELFVVSVHLLTSSSSARNSEARQIRDRILAHVPATDYVVIGGDFNTSTRTESCFSTLSAVVDVNGPWPADHHGNTYTNASRSKPYDHVLVSPELEAFEVPVVIGSSTFPNGLVVDTRVYEPIEEIAPARVGDSGATNMQHMAVVRDFVLQ